MFKNICLLLLLAFADASLAMDSFFKALASCWTHYCKCCQAKKVKNDEEDPEKNEDEPDCCCPWIDKFAFIKM